MIHCLVLLFSILRKVFIWIFSNSHQKKEKLFPESLCLNIHLILGDRTDFLEWQPIVEYVGI